MKFLVVCRAVVCGPTLVPSLSFVRVYLKNRKEAAIVLSLLNRQLALSRRRLGTQCRPHLAGAGCLCFPRADSGCLSITRQVQDSISMPWTSRKHLHWWLPVTVWGKFHQNDYKFYKLLVGNIYFPMGRDECFGLAAKCSLLDIPVLLQHCLCFSTCFLFICPLRTCML